MREPLLGAFLWKTSNRSSCRLLMTTKEWLCEAGSEKTTRGAPAATTAKQERAITYPRNKRGVPCDGDLSRLSSSGQEP
jgi:hypothetical protein